MKNSHLANGSAAIAQIFGYAANVTLQIDEIVVRNQQGNGTNDTPQTEKALPNVRDP